MDYVTIKGKKYELKEVKVEVLVPKNIQFTKNEEGYSMGLQFNDSKQELYYSSEKKIYEVCHSYFSYLITPKLIPCKREDIGIGEWGFKSDYKTSTFDSKSGYFLRTDKGEFIFIVRNKFILGVYFNYEYYWKVVEVK